MNNCGAPHRSLGAGNTSPVGCPPHLLSPAPLLKSHGAVPVAGLEPFGTHSPRHLLKGTTMKHPILTDAEIAQLEKELHLEDRSRMGALGWAFGSAAFTFIVVSIWAVS